MADRQESSVASNSAAGDLSNKDSSIPKAVIKNVDMSEEMQQDAVDIASAALEKYNIEKDIAANIKKEFDKRHGPTWHVVVGKNFGSYVTHGMYRPHPRNVFLSLHRGTYAQMLGSSSILMKSQREKRVYRDVRELHRVRTYFPCDNKWLASARCRTSLGK